MIFYFLSLCLTLAYTTDLPLFDCYSNDLDLLFVAGLLPKDTMSITRMKNVAGYFLDNQQSKNRHLRVSIINFYILKTLKFTRYQLRDEMEKDFDKFLRSIDDYTNVSNFEDMEKYNIEFNSTLLRLKSSKRQHIIVWFLQCQYLCDFDLRFTSTYCSMLYNDFNLLVIIVTDITEYLTLYRNCLIHATAIRTDDSLENMNVLGLKLCGQCSKGWWTYQSQQRPYVSSCYKVQPASQLITKTVAQDKCQEMKASLVNIETYEELQWLSLRLKTQETTVQYIAIFTGLYFKKYRMVHKYEWSNERPFLISSALTNSTLSSYSDMCWVLKFANDGISRNISNNILKIIEPVLCNVPVANFIMCELELLGHTHTQDDPKPNNDEFVQGLKLIDKPMNIDKYNLFNCGGHDQYLVYSKVCDGYIDCKGGLDEEYCLGISIQGNMNNYFVCTHHSKILNTVIRSQLSKEQMCNGVQDCIDNMDEKFCGDECEEKLCSDGTCIPNHWLKIIDNDCKKYFSDKINDKDYYQNPNGLNETKLLPYEISQCNENETLTSENDENSSRMKSRYKVKWSPTCVYIKGRSGSIMGCSDLSHLKNCENFTCPPNLAKCPYSYCVPTHYMFDGVQDCMYGEDEALVLSVTNKDLQDCFNVFPRVEGIRICDDRVQCFNIADEVSCHGFCPAGFKCMAGVVMVEDTAVNVSQQTFDTLDKDTKVLNMSGLDLSFEKVFFHLKNPLELYLSHCNISSDFMSFDSTDLLYKVDMSYNNLTKLTGMGIFSVCGNLQFLYLQHNDMLAFIEGDAITSNKLRILNLSYTKISFLPSKILKSKVLEQLILVSTNLLSLEFFPSTMVVAILDLRNITTLHLNLKGIYGLKGVQVTNAMYTDDYRLCCPQLVGKGIPLRFCYTPVDVISSCSDLVADGLKRILLWVVAFIASVGNAIVLFNRILFDIDVFSNAFGVFAACLGISDFLMGIYLFIIASVDVYYREVYVLHEMEWRGSTWCRVAGFLSTFSGETSAFFVLLITVDRYLVMAYPFGQLRFKSWSLHLSVALAWLLGVIIAVVPVSVPNWTIYSSNGMCFGLPLINRDVNKGQHYVSVFIALNFIIYSVIAIGQMSIFKAMFRNRVIQESKVNATRREKDVEVAKQLFLVAMSNFICWFPISITGVISKCGVVLSPEVYIWLVVFILPLNAAVNPLIYTIPFIYRKWYNFKKGREYKTDSSTH